MKSQETEIELVRRSRCPSSLGGSLERKTAGKATSGEDTGVELSQEAETVVNDFLATFSALYTDIPPNERTKILACVPLVEEGYVEDSDEGDRD